MHNALDINMGVLKSLTHENHKNAKRALSIN